ncbi:MAG: hypothetical protein NVSMB64_19080 [Candidatus Velthaea sp.]
MPDRVRAATAAALLLVLSSCGQPATSLPLTVASSRGAALQKESASSASGLFRVLSLSGCPPEAVFIRLDQELRGYPLAARGPTPPCALVRGPKTQLLERGPLVVSVHGYLHSLSFQADGPNGLTVHGPDANGNVAPIRIGGVNQDYVALAVDSSINDFIVASQGYEGDQCWYILRENQQFSDRFNCDPNITAIRALATNRRDELIVAGSDANSGEARLDVYEQPASDRPHLARSITGERTGLAALSGTLGYFDLSYALATDPASGSIYVYDHLFNFLGGGRITGAGPAKISEFASDANGNVAPVRVLAGPHVPLVDFAFGVNVLSVDRGGNVYALAPGHSLAVSVFGPHARGNTPPERTFTDRSAIIGDVGASIAIRSSPRR